MPARVHDHARVKHFLAAILVLHANAGLLVAVESHIEDTRLLVNVNAVLAGVVEHHVVEFAAKHLPRLRAFVRVVLEEVERLRFFALIVGERDRVLLGERGCLHLVEHAEPAEREVRVRHERFADVEAGKLFPLEEANRVTLLGNEGTRGGTGRTTTDDNDFG